VRCKSKALRRRRRSTHRLEQRPERGGRRRAALVIEAPQRGNSSFDAWRADELDPAQRPAPELIRDSRRRQERDPEARQHHLLGRVDVVELEDAARRRPCRPEQRIRQVVVGRRPVEQDQPRVAHPVERDPAAAGERVARLEANLRRLGYSAEIVTADALDYRPDRPFDGVLLDARRMAEASGCVAEIALDCLALSDAFVAAVGDDDDARLFAATGGDDYALLAALPPELDPATLCLPSGTRMSCVGSLHAGEPQVRLTSGGKSVDMPESLGFEHSRRPYRDLPGQGVADRP